MSSDRTSKQIAERIDIDYYQRPHPMRRWKRITAWSCLALAGVAAFIPLLIGKKTVYQAGPLSTPHAMLAEKCSECHTEKWQTAMRLVSLEEAHRSVPDDACKKCHQDIGVHAPNEMPSMVAACSECHREHRGNMSLVRMSDSLCVNCHGDLKTCDGAKPNCEQCLVSWKTHPEFAVIRNNVKDPTQLYFNHKVHVAPGGIRTPDGKMKKLNCVDCHQLDATGRNLLPVRYETACASCHENALAFDHRLFPGKNAPHGDQNNLRAWLRNEYTQYLLNNPGAVDGAAAKSGGRAMPHHDLRKLTKSDWNWVQSHTENAERMLLTGAGGCKYCHMVDTNTAPVTIIPPAAPHVWMSASRFNHKSHDTMKCEECHASVMESSETSDVLLCSIQVCQKCHGNSSMMEVKARSDCAECHTYHDGKHSIGPMSPHQTAAKGTPPSAQETAQQTALADWAAHHGALPSPPTKGQTKGLTDSLSDANFDVNSDAVSGNASKLND